MVIAQINPPAILPNSKNRLTIDEYHEIEETAEERHEYCNGEVTTMFGGTATHSEIAINLLIYLGFLLRDTNFVCIIAICACGFLTISVALIPI